MKDLLRVGCQRGRLPESTETQRSTWSFYLIGNTGRSHQDDCGERCPPASDISRSQADQTKPRWQDQAHRQNIALSQRTCVFTSSDIGSASARRPPLLHWLQSIVDLCILWLGLEHRVYGTDGGSDMNWTLRPRPLIS